MYYVFFYTFNNKGIIKYLVKLENQLKQEFLLESHLQLKVLNEQRNLTFQN